MRSLRIVPVFALAAIAACSSGGSQPGSGPAPETTNIVHPNTLYTDGDSYNITTVENKTVYLMPILAPADSVWRVLPSVFLALNMDPKTVNSAQRYIANTSVTVRHSIGQSPVSKYLDCGNSNVGKTANQAEVTMSLTVQVVGDSAAASSLHIQFEAYAMQDGYAHNRIQCTSTGQMEQLVAKLTNEELAHRTKN